MISNISKLRQLGLRFKPQQLNFSSKFLSSKADQKSETPSSTIPEAPTNGTNADSGKVEKELRDEISKFATENSALLAKSREFEDKYLRALAEAENMRMRLTKQIQDSKLYAIQGFCKDLTEIEDILHMAIESVPKEEVKSGNKAFKDLYEGLSMTEARLLQVFKHHGLVQLNPINAKFNPNEHDAIMQKEEEGKESGTIIFVSKLGYRLHERVIRPAIVGVAK